MQLSSFKFSRVINPRVYPPPFTYKTLRCVFRILPNVSDGSFEKKINGFQSQLSITMFVKSSILDVWQGSEYASDHGILQLSINAPWIATNIIDWSHLNNFYSTSILMRWFLTSHHCIQMKERWQSTRY